MRDLLTPMSIQPTTLSNGIVELTPITMSHASDLCEALDDRVFEFMAMRSQVNTLPQVRRYIEFQMSRENTIVFTVIDCSTRKAVGSTSFMNIRRDHRSVEIGSTWISSDARGTKINPSMKYLMLEHAFETCGAVRVELVTDSRNERSRRAIRKLGATEEGILRQHMVMPDGVLRDTAVHSILDAEWPSVKSRLEERITQ